MRPASPAPKKTIEDVFLQGDLKLLFYLLLFCLYLPVLLRRWLRCLLMYIQTICIDAYIALHKNTCKARTNTCPPYFGGQVGLLEKDMYPR